MNPNDQTDKEKAPAPKPTEEPKSAHATPVVEKYIETRNEKATDQIKNEEQGNAH